MNEYDAFWDALWTDWLVTPPPPGVIVVARWHDDRVETPRRVRVCKVGCCAVEGHEMRVPPRWWLKTDDQSSPLGEERLGRTQK